jgi:glycosyltransferase involved in cell wall biosynthesis
MSQPVVSIFLPYYNDEEYLKTSVDSVLNQTYRNWELILVNHGSLDGSRDIARSYNDPRIKHIDFKENMNPGFGPLLTAFLKIAKGKYIKFFCADDVMLDICIEELANYLQTNPDKDFAFGDMRYVDQNLNYFPHTWFVARPNFNINYQSKEILKRFFNLQGILPYPSSIVRKESLNFGIEQISVMTVDCSIWINLLIGGSKCGFIDKVLTLYRIGQQQISCLGNADKSMLWGMYEQVVYYKLFYQITDIGLIKYLLSDDKYAQSLKSGEEEFIPFVLSLYYQNMSPQARFLGRLYLGRILSDEAMRDKIEKRFGYTLKNLRQSLLDDPVLLIGKNSPEITLYKQFGDRDNVSLSLLFKLLRHNLHVKIKKFLNIKTKSKRQKETYYSL